MPQQKKRGVIKGKYSSILLSALIHLLILSTAGGLVIFTIMEKQAQKFVPVQIARPKMNIKKPQIKVKTTIPRKNIERIVSSRRNSSISDIQLPKMTGMGSGMDEKIGGFEMLADLSDMTIFGSGKSFGNDLEGTYYHIMRDRAGNRISAVQPALGSTGPQYAAVLNRFLGNNWSPSEFDAYYRSPMKLYATHFMVPPCASSLGPSNFGVSEDVQAALWMAHYKGKISYPKGGRFRFWGLGDNFLFVRINGKVVLDAGYGDLQYLYPNLTWRSTAKEHRKYKFGHARSRVGDWFTLEPGVPVEMEVLMGEAGGGLFCAMLNIEEWGVDYPKNREGAPILPFFKTRQPPEHILAEIKSKLIPDESMLEGGPVFSAQ